METVEVAQIPPEIALRGFVVVRLDPAIGGRTYAEIAERVAAHAPTPTVTPIPGSETLLAPPRI